MFEKLKIKTIYDDFINKVGLTKEQKRILDMVLEKNTYVKIGLEIGMSERTVGTEVSKIKALYQNYKELELAKINILKE